METAAIVSRLLSSAASMQTQVGIVGAGPAGLLLSHLLAREGIASVVLEAKSRDYVEHRVRAGVLEQASVELLIEAGLGDRLQREALVHQGIELRFGGVRHRIALTELTGRSIWIYGQQEVVKDLIAARSLAGGAIQFEAEEVSLEDIDSSRPKIRYRQGGEERELECDFVAGCDGFHGVSREAVPHSALRTYSHEYPFAWLGILAAVAPSTDELIYAAHERGFALHSLRSPQISRLYIQVGPDAERADWPDDRVWEELRIRLACDGFRLRDGPVLEKTIAPMRAFVVEPMQHGRLFLAGDAAHIVPATGAKGMNLAIHDAHVLARALDRWYRTGSARLLDGYTAACLPRVWRAQEFSSSMSSMLHRLPGSDDFLGRLQRAQLQEVCSSETAARSLAENYVGRPYER
jgi:p-hydroxybenzoate 3-monooxygenase